MYMKKAREGCEGSAKEEDGMDLVMRSLKFLFSSGNGERW